MKRLNYILLALDHIADGVREGLVHDEGECFDLPDLGGWLSFHRDGDAIKDLYFSIYDDHELLQLKFQLLSDGGIACLNQNGPVDLEAEESARTSALLTAIAAVAVNVGDEQGAVLRIPDFAWPEPVGEASEAKVGGDDDRGASFFTTMMG